RGERRQRRTLRRRGAGRRERHAGRRESGRESARGLWSCLLDITAPASGLGNGTSGRASCGLRDRLCLARNLPGERRDAGDAHGVGFERASCAKGTCMRAGAGHESPACSAQRDAPSVRRAPGADGCDARGARRACSSRRRAESEPHGTRPLGREARAYGGRRADSARAYAPVLVRGLPCAFASALRAELEFDVAGVAQRKLFRGRRASSVTRQGRRKRCSAARDGVRRGKGGARRGGGDVRRRTQVGKAARVVPWGSARRWTWVRRVLRWTGGHHAPCSFARAREGRLEAI
ncbi:hypothetical protein B0H15DRAFT_839926, partial [Mycena belliarum]